MYYELFGDELIKRYMFLHENKELILALCIKKVNVDDNLKKEISSWEEYSKIIRAVDNDLFDAIIKSIKDQLGKDKCYLCHEVSTEIVDAFDEVLFTDGYLEDTKIYKHVNALLNDDKFFDSVNSLICDLEERRQCNQHLKKIPTFTVWKILNYVREKYNKNSVALDALDKYYNIERTMMSGLDSNCGYFISDEEFYDEEKVSKYYDSTIVSGVSGSYIISSYSGNEYEKEDDYFVSKEDRFAFNQGESTTVFMEVLSKMPLLSVDKKLSIRNHFYGDKKYILE